MPTAVESYRISQMMIYLRHDLYLYAVYISLARVYPYMIYDICNALSTTLSIIHWMDDARGGGGERECVCVRVEDGFQWKDGVPAWCIDCLFVYPSRLYLGKSAWL